MSLTQKEREMKKGEKVEKIVIDVYAHGDRSVGMFPFTVKITFENLDMQRDIEDPCGPTGREDFRKDLAEFMYRWLDYGKIDVTFEDECADCFELKEKCKCKEIGIK